MYLPLPAPPAPRLISIQCVIFLSLLSTPSLTNVCLFLGGIFSFPDVSFSTQRKRNKTLSSHPSLSHDTGRNKMNPLSRLSFRPFSCSTSSPVLEASGPLQCERRRCSLCLTPPPLLTSSQPAVLSPRVTDWASSPHGSSWPGGPQHHPYITFQSPFTWHFESKGLALPIGVDSRRWL